MIDRKQAILASDFVATSTTGESMSDIPLDNAVLSLLDGLNREIPIDKL